MNLEQMKKNVGQVVRLRPIAERYDDEGTHLDQYDDYWKIMDVSDAGVMIRNLATDHTRTLFRDQIHHYASDQPVQGQTRGFLVLNVQLYIVGLELQVEPTSRPGEPVDRPPLLKHPPSLLARTAKTQGRLEFEASRRAFRDAPASIKEADAEFQSMVEHARVIGAELQAVMRDAIPEVLVNPSLGFLRIAMLGNGALLRWKRYANTLSENELRVSYWRGHPPFPGLLMLPGLNDDYERSETAVDTYAFDMLPTGAHLWVLQHPESEARTSRELVEEILHKLFDFSGA